MVNNIPVDFTDEYSFTNKAEILVDHDTVSYFDHFGDEVAYKRVVLHGLWPDTSGGVFSISFSPIRALLLVKRLVAALDELSREGVVVPQLHSSFMNAYDEVCNLDHMPPHYFDLCQSIKASMRLTDGELIAEAIPPAVR